MTKATGTRSINFDDASRAIEPRPSLNSDGPLTNRYAARASVLRARGQDGGAILNINTFGVNGQQRAELRSRSTPP